MNFYVLGDDKFQSSQTDALNRQLPLFKGLIGRTDINHNFGSGFGNFI